MVAGENVDRHSKTRSLLFVSNHSIFGKKSHGIETERIIPYISENGRLDFLKIYFSNIRDRNYITEFLELNKDATIIKNCSAGSNATTLLCIKNNDMLFRKYALGDDGEKLYAQVKWLRDNADKALYYVKELGRNNHFWYHDMKN